jgi:hypothetical protein
MVDDARPLKLVAGAVAEPAIGGRWSCTFGLHASFVTASALAPEGALWGEARGTRGSEDRRITEEGARNKSASQISPLV